MGKVRVGCAPCLWIVLCARPFARIYGMWQKQTGHIEIEDRKNRCVTKGLRDRNSPTCTLSQNGYGAGTDSTAYVPVHRTMFRLLLLLCLLLGGCCGCGWLACCDASRVVIIAHSRVAVVACVAAGAACWVAWGCTTSSSPGRVLGGPWVDCLCWGCGCVFCCYSCCCCCLCLCWCCGGCFCCVCCSGCACCCGRLTCCDASSILNVVHACVAVLACVSVVFACCVAAVHMDLLHGV